MRSSRSEIPISNARSPQSARRTPGPRPVGSAARLGAARLHRDGQGRLPFRHGHQRVAVSGLRGREDWISRRKLRFRVRGAAGEGKLVWMPGVHAAAAEIKSTPFRMAGDDWQVVTADLPAPLTKRA